MLDKSRSAPLSQNAWSLGMVTKKSARQIWFGESVSPIPTVLPLFGPVMSTHEMLVTGPLPGLLTEMNG